MINLEIEFSHKMIESYIDVEDLNISEDFVDFIIKDRHYYFPITSIYSVIETDTDYEDENED